MYSRFEELCKKKGVSAYAVSKSTGVRQQVISAWKCGVSTPKVDKIKKIADYFGVPLSYFYE